MTGTFVPAATVVAARKDLGLVTNGARCQKFTSWQTRGRITCAPYCASALSYWLDQAGFKFVASEHVWADRGDWNVTAFRQWAQAHGLWRTRSTRARASWGVVMNFGEVDQHIGLVVSDGGGNVATIEGNTNGGQVLARSRYRANVEGFIAFDEAGQTATTAAKPLTPKEIKIMGQRCAALVPGAARRKNGRYPTVDAFLNADGTTDLRGLNGVVLKGQTSSGMGVSFLRLGRLSGPISSIEAVRDKQGLWRDSMFLATAEDGGTFEAHVDHIAAE